MLESIAYREQVQDRVLAPTKVAERVDLSWLERAFDELPQEAVSTPGVIPLDSPDVPERGYRIVNNQLEKWVPVYGKALGRTALEVVQGLGGGLTPPQVGWRIEAKELHDSCQCHSGKFSMVEGSLVHLDGCGRRVTKRDGESAEEWRTRILSIQKHPDDDYLNGMYPTLGGRNDKDPKSWITRGRSEYRERTKGMILWGSSKKDSASWNGNTLAALDRVRDDKKKKEGERLQLAAEKWSKKSAPRKLGEL